LLNEEYFQEMRTAYHEEMEIFFSLLRQYKTTEKDRTMIYSYFATSFKFLSDYVMNEVMYRQRWW